VNHPILDRHDAIAWDVDKTLVNGPNSEFFCRYVKAHPEKKHVIVTFRTGAGYIRRGQSWAEDAFEEVAVHGLSRKDFAGLLSVPDHLYDAYASADGDAALVDEFCHWKGQAAASAGCTVLVDDMEPEVIDGCQRHGVAFINSLAPLVGLPVT